MNAIDQLNLYLRRVEGRLRLLAISKGAALTTVAALLITVLLVWIINGFAFSNVSVLSARFLLFVAVAAAIGFGLVIPLLRLNRGHAAKTAESKFPDFEQRLLTMAEKSRQGTQQADPFVQLLAADTMNVARASEPEKLAPKVRIFGFLTSASAAVFALLWLIFAGPGFLGYGTSLLWAGAPKSGSLPMYDIIVSPGNKSVRRKSDQLITAKLLGFNSRNVRLFAQYHGTSKWEQVNMAAQPEGSGFEFLFGGLAENVEYYVEAGTAASKHYTLKVVDLPGVKKIRVTYHYPKWSGMKDAVEDPGGDLRAVEGTEAEVAIQMDKPLSKGMLMISDDSQVALAGGEGNWLTGRVPIKKDGTYHVAALDAGENVRLSEDFFIEARKDSPPVVKILRPGRDTKVNPIEEVTVAVEGEDDFGLQELDLKYSVNGGAEKSVSLLKQAGAKNASGSHVIYLEEYKMAPGDIVSIYATARDAQHSVKTDMYFIEAQPYEKNYSQSQQAGGAGGAGQQADNEISQRQKDIIAATFNERKNGQKNPKESAEDAKFLYDLQSKLSGQAKSLAERMKARQLAGANQEFESFVKDMDQASEAMLEGADKIKQQKWQEALAPQQKALQHALRAEATFRDIQVAFGQKGGGGGGAGGAGRDLENLFDLELDTEKNQYETGQQQSAGDQQQQAVDKALEKLKELARRQQELAAKAQKDQQNFQQRWEQEMLRREAEELKRQMEQLQRGESAQQGQQGQQGQKGQQGQSGQQSGQQSAQQSGQPASSPSSPQTNKDQRTLARRQQPISDPRMKEALDRLSQATEEMRQAAAGQQSGNAGQNASGQRRAADNLQQAKDILGGMQHQQSAQGLDDMVKQAEQLAAHQEDYQNRLRQTFSNPSLNGLNGTNRQQPGQTNQNDKLAAEKEKMADDVKRLERQMQGAVSQTRDSQPGVSTKLREALAEVQQNDLAARMKKGAEWIRQGQGAYTWVRESLMTQGVDKLRDQLKDAQAAAQGQGENANSKDPGKSAAERALARVEAARNRLEQMTQGRGRQGQKGPDGKPGQSGKDGQQQGGEPGQQSGGQNGGQAGEQSGSQPGGQQSGQQQGGQGSGQQRGSYGSMGGPGPVGPYSGSGNEMGNAARDLSQARQDVRDADPGMGREAEQLIKELQKLNLGSASSAQLDDRIQRQLLPALEHLELELRRKVEEQRSGQVRSAGSEPVPTGYSESVAEYFRRLSKGK